MAENELTKRSTARNKSVAGEIGEMLGWRREEGYARAVLTVVSEGEVEPWIVVRGVHDDAR